MTHMQELHPAIRNKQTCAYTCACVLSRTHYKRMQVRQGQLKMLQLQADSEKQQASLASKLTQDAGRSPLVSWSLSASWRVRMLMHASSTHECAHGQGT